MTNGLLQHTCKSGLQLTALEDGSIQLEDEECEILLTEAEVDDLVRLLERAHARIQHPEVIFEPPPFPIVNGVVFQGADGPEMVVDLAEQIREMAIRNARLLQDLADLEHIRDHLEAQLHGRNGKA